MKKCLYLLLLLLFLPSLAEGALTEDQLRTIWRNNGAVEGIQVFRYGVVDWQGGSVAAEGRAPVRSPSPSSRLLAKRAALTDARRNLLFLPSSPRPAPRRMSFTAPSSPGSRRNPASP